MDGASGAVAAGPRRVHAGGPAAGWECGDRPQEL